MTETEETPTPRDAQQFEVLLRMKRMIDAMERVATRQAERIDHLERTLFGKTL